MPWVGDQRLLIEVHRLDQPPGLEVLKGFGEQVRGRPGARA